MFYTIYKITNKVNGKIYIGAHKTIDLDDGYMGSGTYLQRAKDKYGIENFEKDILEVFESSEEMFEMESKLVNSDFVDRDDTYNLKEGGSGGFDYINTNALNRDSSKHRISGLGLKKTRIENPDKFRELDIAFGERVKIKHANGEYLYSAPFAGKTHSDESKKKMSEARKGKVSGENNPSFGTMWIHSLTEKVSKKINKDEFSEWEAKGWLKGRKMKFI